MTWATPRTCFTAPLAVTIRNAKLTSTPDMARAIMDSNDGQVVRVNDRRESRSTVTFVAGSNSKMR